MPPVSEKQRRAMWAAREGHSTLGISPAVGKKFVGPGQDTAKDMEPYDWKGLVGGLIKFFTEEAKEPEHQGNDAELTAESDRKKKKLQVELKALIDKGLHNIDRARRAKEIRKELKDLDVFSLDAQISAAGIMFVDPDNNALFLKRSSTGRDHGDEWCFPGGVIEDGEDAEQAAHREANEELGSIPEGNLEPLHQAKSNEGIDFTTYKQSVGEQFEPTLNDEHDDYVWAPLDNPPEPLHPGVAAMLAQDADVSYKGFYIVEQPNGKFKLFKNGRLYLSTKEFESVDRAKTRIDILVRDRDKLAGSLGSEDEVCNTINSSCKPPHSDNPKAKVTGPGTLGSSGFAGAMGDEEAEDSDTPTYTARDEDFHNGKVVERTAFGGRKEYKATPKVGESKTFSSREEAVAWLEKHKGKFQQANDGKLSHTEVAYGPGKPESHCGICQFFKNNDCELVVDPIERFGWCKLFTADSKDATTAMDSKQEPEHTVEIQYDGDFDMGGFLRSIWRLGAQGASRNVVVEEDEEPFQSNWDGDGADKVWSAKIDGVDILKQEGAKDEALQLAMDRCVIASSGGEKYALDLAKNGSMREYDADGHLHVKRTPISKSNICPYVGEEIPDYEELGLDPRKVYQLFRHPDELEKAASTSNGKPFMRKHVPVSADDHQPYDVIGATGNDAEWEEPYLYNSLVVWPQEDIDKIESGDKVQISAGYRYRADMTPGSYKGTPFDGVMRDIIFNHSASVEEGRSGVDVRVLDSVNPKVGWAAIEAAILEMREPT